MTWSRTALLVVLLASLLCNLLLVWFSRVDVSSHVAQPTDGDNKHLSNFIRSSSKPISSRLLLSEQSLFGGLETIQPSILIYSLLIIVVGVIALELLSSVTHKYTADTPWDKMVIALEKELMIVGCTAFLFKLFLSQNTDLSHDWLFSLEYADLLIPIFAFSNCVKGFMLILLSYYLSFFWGKSNHLSNEELIIEFLEGTAPSSWRKVVWDIVHPEVNQIEFAIVHDLFCDVYRFHHDAFAFDLYVRRVLEKFVQEIIEIRQFNWVFLIGLMCGYFIHPEERAPLSQSKCGTERFPYNCERISHTVTFTLAGCAMFVITSFTACVVRHYELQLLRKRGVRGTVDYPNYLLFLNALDHQNDQQSNRMDREELKKHMLSLERSKSLYLTPNKGTAELERDDACGGFDYSTQRWISLTSDSVNTPSKDAISVQVTDDGEPLPPISSKYQRVNVTYDRVSSTKDRFDNPGASTNDRDRIISSFHDQVPAGGGDDEEEEEDEVGPSSSQPAAHDSSQHMTDVPFKMDDATLLRFKHERLSAVSSDTDFIANIFLFGRPQLLFEFLQIVVIALSLYVSLWITNYAFLPIPGWLKFVAFLPYIGSVFSFAVAVKSAVLLKSLVKVDRELVLEILEEEEAATVLAEMLRAQILSQLGQDNIARNIEQLKEVFRKYDTDGSNFLSHDEYKGMLKTFKVTYSAKKWRMLFTGIDRNYDGQISIEEFVQFVFPNSMEALDNQRRLHEDNCRKLKSMMPALKKAETMAFDEMFDSSRDMEDFEGHHNRDSI